MKCMIRIPMSQVLHPSARSMGAADYSGRSKIFYYLQLYPLSEHERMSRYNIPVDKMSEKFNNFISWQELT